MPIAIITGASRGLGLELARALAQRGWALIINARGATELERVALHEGAHLLSGRVEGADELGVGAGEGFFVLADVAADLGLTVGAVYAAAFRWVCPWEV